MGDRGIARNVSVISRDILCSDEGGNEDEEWSKQERKAKEQAKGRAKIVPREGIAINRFIKMGTTRMSCYLYRSCPDQRSSHNMADAQKKITVSYVMPCYHSSCEPQVSKGIQFTRLNKVSYLSQLRSFEPKNRPRTMHIQHISKAVQSTHHVISKEYL